jgi:hypothetical protein
LAVIAEAEASAYLRNKGKGNNFRMGRRVYGSA